VKGKKIMRVYISDGRVEPLVGKCVFFLREKRDELTPANVMVPCLLLITAIDNVTYWHMPSKTRRKGITSSPVVNEERMRPGHWL